MFASADDCVRRLVDFRTSGKFPSVAHIVPLRVCENVTIESPNKNEIIKTCRIIQRIIILVE